MSDMQEYNPDIIPEKDLSAQESTAVNDYVATAPKPLISEGWLRALLYFFAFFLTLIITQGISFALLMSITGMPATELGEYLETSPELAPLTLLQFITLLGLLVQTWLFCRFIDKRSMYDLGFAYKGFVRDGLKGIGVGIGLISVGFVLLWLLGFLRINGLNFSPSVLLGSAFLCIIIALNEEIFIRGYILNNLMKSINPYAALGISSLLFSLMHVLNPNIGIISGINIVLAGVLLGVYYIFKKNLWFPIGLHFAWNFFQGPVLGFEVSGLNLQGIVAQTVSGSPLVTGGDFGFEGSLMLTLLLLAAIAWVHKQYAPPTADKQQSM